MGNDLLLAQHVEGVDVIIGGHSHTHLQAPVMLTENDRGEPIAPTVIGQAGEYGQHLGVMQVTFDDNGNVLEVNGELLATAEREPDAEAAALLAPYTAKIEEVRDTLVGARVVQPCLTPPRQG